MAGATPPKKIESDWVVFERDSGGDGTRAQRSATNPKAEPGRPPRSTSSASAAAPSDLTAGKLKSSSQSLISGQVIDEYVGSNLQNESDPRTPPRRRADPGLKRSKSEDFILVEAPLSDSSEAAAQSGSFTASEMELVLKSTEHIRDTTTKEAWKEMQRQKNAQSRDDQRKTWLNIATPSSCAEARAKLKFIVRKGIPDSRRAEVWKTLVGACPSDLSNAYLEKYSEKLAQIFGDKIPKRILKPATFGASDLPFGDHFLVVSSTVSTRQSSSPALISSSSMSPSTSGLKTSSSKKQPRKEDLPAKSRRSRETDPLMYNLRETTRRVLCVLASDFPDIVFAPPLVDLALAFLQFMSEEEAFWMLFSILRESKRGSFYFPLNAKDFNLEVEAFRGMIATEVPKLSAHMEKIGVDSSDLSHWFFRLFAGELPYQTFLRVIDAFLCEGFKILYRVGIALMKKFSAELLKNGSTKVDFMNLLKLLCGQTYDEDALMKVAFSLAFARADVSTIKKKVSEKIPIRNRDGDRDGSNVYYRPKVKETPELFAEELFELIYEWLPHRLRIKDPSRVFTSAKSGYALKSFLSVMEDTDSALVVMKASSGAVFGLFTNAAWLYNGGFVGSSECFLFILHPKVQCFEWNTEAKRNFLHVERDKFTFGMGDKGTALSVRDDWIASSRTSEMFNNPPLGSLLPLPQTSDSAQIVRNKDLHPEEFEITAVEVYSFE